MKKILLFIIGIALLSVIGCKDKSSPTSPVEASKPLSQTMSKPQTYNYIPLVVVLYQEINYNGPKRYFVEENGDLTSNNFNDLASSVIVYAGPDYDSYKADNGGQEPTVTLYQDASYYGPKIVLKVGKYSSLVGYNLNDKISSVRFLADPNPQTPDSNPESTFSNIHTVLKLFQHINYGGWYVVILGTTNTEHKNLNDFVTVFGGSGMNDFASSYIALPGPNATVNRGVRLWSNAYYNGYSFDVYGDRYDSGNLPAYLNDVFSSSQSLNN